tara:strand:+ start:627 stop:773 length:147 start_codon:yes stop_codon:yes gene_type:complete
MGLPGKSSFDPSASLPAFSLNLDDMVWSLNMVFSQLFSRIGMMTGIWE